MEKNIKSNNIFSRLDEYKSVFYKSRIKSGILTFITFSVGSFVILSITEYLLYFSKQVRLAMFLLWIIFTFIELYRNVGIWLFRKWNIIPSMSYTEAAQQIGQKNEQISDKLLNIVQLHELNPSTLVSAAIADRTKHFSSISFTDVIDQKDLKRWIKYILVVFSMATVLGIALPEIYTQGAIRMISVNKDFVASMPYSYQLITDDLTVKEGENLSIEVALSGTRVPDKLKIVLSAGGSLLMENEGKGRFLIDLAGLSDDADFHFSDGEFDFGHNMVNVLHPPKIYDQITIIYPPAHTKLKKQELEGWKNLDIPEGSKVELQLRGEDIASVKDTASTFDFKNSSDVFVAASIAQKALSDLVVISSDEDELREVIHWNIIRDEYPNISLSAVRDQEDNSKVIFQGNIADDYGIKKLTVFWKIKGEEGWKKNVVDVLSNPEPQNYYTVINVGNEAIEYKAIVIDNDAVNGYKSSSTKVAVLSEVSKRDIRKIQTSDREQVVDKAQKLLSEQQSRSEQIEDLLNKIKTGEKVTWKEKQSLKKMIQSQREDMERLEKLKDEFKKSNELSNDEELKEKEEQLEKLMEKTLDPETLEKLKELEKLLDKLNQNDFEKELEEYKKSSEELKKDLDRNIELLKRLEVEQEMQSISDELKDLSEKQEELSKKDSDTQSEQEEIEQEFNDLMERKEEVEQKNEALDQPFDMENTDSEKQEAQDQMQEAKDQLNNKNSKKANKSQEKSSESMKKMSDKMQSSMMQSQSAQSQEDLKSLRQTLDNLIYLSFEQERVLKEIRGTNTTDPKFNALVRDQQKLIDDTKIVEDSLVALSKRVFMIEQTIMRELSDLKHHQSNTLKYYIDRDKNKAQVSNRSAITNINNLALLLDEISQQMQQQMAQQKFGEGSCNKPGSQGKPKPSSIKSMQQQLNQQIEGLKKAMERQGKKGKSGKGGNSKEFAKMAAEQAAIREQVRQMQDAMNGEKGNKGGNGLEGLQQEMEKIEEDLLNKEITEETLMRQEKILTRLLQAENAERERELDEQRESKSGDNNTVFDEELERYRQQKLKELEILRSTPGEYNPYYKKQSSNYLRQ